MRYQELIYIQNDVSGVRNKDILNVNMSSDICIFEAPSFTISGASKIDCTGSTNTVHIISTATTIPLEFSFTGNLESFSATNTSFKYEIYKFNKNAGIFTQPPVFRSEKIEYLDIIDDYVLEFNINVSNLQLDGDYLIKGYFEFDVCTDFLNRLGKTVDTKNFISGLEYGLYNQYQDYHFTAIKSAEKPNLIVNSSTNPPSGSLFQQVILPEKDQTQIVITGAYTGEFVLTLNGLVLSNGYDYTFTGNVVTLVSPTVNGDIISVIYSTSNNAVLTSDYISVDNPILSGITDSQGSNNVFYNITEGKYEIYTSIEPATNQTLLVMLNGLTLVNNIDYYQSVSNKKRIILNGVLTLGDIITIVYFPVTSTINGIFVPNPTVSWMLNNPPEYSGGVFTLEVSLDSSFNNIVSSSSQNYEVGETIYSDTFNLSGSVGTKLYYRIKNEKQYEDLCGSVITNTVYSDVIPIIIQSNAINSY
jgi:hypothetical protein